MMACMILTTSCQQTTVRKPDGRYTDSRWGVFVFREDGVFGYKLAAKFDFYDKENLPPERGRWVITSNEALNIQFDGNPWKSFKLKWKPEDDSFDLIFDEPPERDFPPIITYSKSEPK